MIHLRLTSGGVDRSPCGTLVLGLFAGERPPQGETGWADWRMAGLLSRSILSGRVDATPGSSVLMPPGKLPAARVLVLGLGTAGDFHGRELASALDLALAKIRALRERDFAIAIPGTQRGPWPAESAEVLGRHLLAPLAGSPDEAWVTIHGPVEHLGNLMEWMRRGGRAMARQIQLHEEHDRSAGGTA